jgi:hypothetical protein
MYTHDIRLFLMFFDTVPHVGWTDGLIGSENLFDATNTSLLQFGGFNVTVVSKRMKYISARMLILEYSCALLYRHLCTQLIIWKTVMNYVHMQAHSHKTAEFASLGPLQLGYAVFIASGK